MKTLSNILTTHGTHLPHPFKASSTFGLLSYNGIEDEALDIKPADTAL